MQRFIGLKIIGLAVIFTVVLAACVPVSPAATSTVPTLENIPKPDLGARC